MVGKIIATLRGVAGHPLNRGRKFRAVAEWGVIQVAARLIPGEVCLEFPNRTRLLVSPRMKGAAHFIAPRLCEFEEMVFVMHFLRPEDMFVDVGANVGAYTILAAGAVGARAVAFEPSLETFELLTRNVFLNALQGRVRPVHAAVGRHSGTVAFSSGLGTENCVTKSDAKGSVSVKLTNLDSELAETPPTLLKVDVEGFETEVFGGAQTVLRNPKLQAIIVERNDSGLRYDYKEADLHVQIRQLGFTPCRYEPFLRRVKLLGTEDKGNITYVRNVNESNKRLQTAQAFRLGDFSL